MPVKSGTESKSDRPFPPLVAYFWGCRCYCYCCYCCLFSLFSTSIYRLSQPYRRTEKCPLLKWRRDMSVMSAIRFSRSLSSTRQPTDDGDFYSTFSFIRDFNVIVFCSRQLKFSRLLFLVLADQFLILGMKTEKSVSKSYKFKTDERRKR